MYTKLDELAQFIEESKVLEEMLDLARINLKAFVNDLDIEDLQYSFYGSFNKVFRSEVFYFPYILGFNNREEPMIRIDAPSISLEKIRHLDGYRIYIDGSSWFWDSGLKEAKELLERR